VLIFWSPWICLVECSRSTFALVVSCVQVSNASSFRSCWWGLPVGGPNQWGMGTILGSLGLECWWMAFSSRVMKMYRTMWEIASANSETFFWSVFWLQTSFLCKNMNLICNNLYWNFNIRYCKLMCVDCVLAWPRIAQVDPGWRTPSSRAFYHSWYQSKLETTH
jgi:hypothetical protein